MSPAASSEGSRAASESPPASESMSASAAKAESRRRMGLPWSKSKKSAAVGGAPQEGAPDALQAPTKSPTKQKHGMQFPNLSWPKLPTELGENARSSKSPPPPAPPAPAAPAAPETALDKHVARAVRLVCGKVFKSDKVSDDVLVVVQKQGPKKLGAWLFAAVFTVACLLSILFSAVKMTLGLAFYVVSCLVSPAWYLRAFFTVFRVLRPVVPPAFVVFNAWHFRDLIISAVREELRKRTGVQVTAFRIEAPRWNELRVYNFGVRNADTKEGDGLLSLGELRVHVAYESKTKQVHVKLTLEDLCINFLTYNRSFSDTNLSRLVRKLFGEAAEAAEAQADAELKADKAEAEAPAAAGKEGKEKEKAAAEKEKQKEKWWLLTCDVTNLRVNVKGTHAQLGTQQLVPPLSISSTTVSPKLLAKPGGLLLWLNQLVIRAVASSGIDAVVGSVAFAGQAGMAVTNLAFDNVNRVAAKAGPLSHGIIGATDGARSTIKGAIDGSDAILGGVGTGSKAFVDGFSSGNPVTAAKGTKKCIASICGGLFTGIKLITFGVGGCVSGCTIGLLNTFTCGKACPRKPEEAPDDAPPADAPPTEAPPPPP